MAHNVPQCPTMFFHLPKTSLFVHACTDRPHSPEVQLPVFVLQRHGWNCPLEAVLNEHQLRELTGSNNKRNCKLTSSVGAEISHLSSSHKTDTFLNGKVV